VRVLTGFVTLTSALALCNHSQVARRLVGVREIAKLLGTSRQRADQLVRVKGFPDPVAELASGRCWARSAVVRWAQRDGRSVPWATVELELEQLPHGPAGGAANIYRAVWEIVRMKALGKNAIGAPRTREGAHTIALAAAREVDPAFDAEAPDEVDDLEDESASPSRMLFRGAELWFVRAGDDQRGYWHLEWDGYEWWLRECFTADGSGWNQRSRRALGWCTPGVGLEGFLGAELAASSAPTDISKELLRLAVAHVPEALSQARRSH
jgi:predicted DNA-binding transcriptional regulator AlpA